MMCYGCWVEFGLPSIVNERTKDAARKIAALYELTLIGEPLHAFLDDWNIDGDMLYEKSNIEACEDPGLALRAQDIYDVMLPMSVNERASALAIHDGFLKVEI